jgi:hypothetical protein
MNGERVVVVPVRLLLDVLVHLERHVRRGRFDRTISLQIDRLREVLEQEIAR